MSTIHKHLSRVLLVCAATTSIAACATTGVEESSYSQAQWAANGWLTPERRGEPDLIGLYATVSDCKAALRQWKAQHEGDDAVDGECLPIDRH